MWIPLILSVITVVFAAPTDLSHERQMTSVMDAMLNNYNIFASQRENPAAIDALNRTFELFFTNSAGEKKIESLTRCAKSERNLQSISHTLNWYPWCNQLTLMNTFATSAIPELIREMDAVKFENNGAYKVNTKTVGSTQLAGSWTATQKVTKAKMNCNVALQFKEVGPNEIGLFGMLMDCDTCNFDDFKSSRSPMTF